MKNRLSRLLAGMTERDQISEQEAERLAALATEAQEDGEEEDEEEMKSQEDDEEEPDEESKAQEDGEDEDEEDESAEAAEGSESSQQARKAERARVKAILTAAPAKGRETLARHLAFETDLSAKDARAVLDASPARKRGALADAMAAVEQPRLGPGGARADGGPESESQAAARLAGYVNVRPNAA